MAAFDNLPNAIREGMRFSEEATDAVVEPVLKLWGPDVEETPDEAWDVVSLGTVVLRSQLGEKGFGDLLNARADEMTEELYLHLNLMHDGEEYLQQRAGACLRVALDNCEVKGGVATLNVEGTKAMFDSIIYIGLAAMY